MPDPAATMTVTPASVLRACLDDVRHEDRVCVGALARDAQGRGVSPLDPEACCWCSLGLLIKHGFDDVAFDVAAGAIEAVIGSNDIGPWHDSATPAERVRVTEMALANVEVRAVAEVPA